MEYVAQDEESKEKFVRSLKDYIDCKTIGEGMRFKKDNRYELYDKLYSYLWKINFDNHFVIDGPKLTEKRNIKYCYTNASLCWIVAKENYFNLL